MPRDGKVADGPKRDDIETIMASRAKKDADDRTLPLEERDGCKGYVGTMGTRPVQG